MAGASDLVGFAFAIGAAVLAIIGLSRAVGGDRNLAIIVPEGAQATQARESGSESGGGQSAVSERSGLTGSVTEPEEQQLGDLTLAPSDQLDTSTVQRGTGLELDFGEDRGFVSTTNTGL